MLDPQYLAGVSDQLLAIIDELELAIIADISKRLVKTGSITDTSRGQAQIAQEAGLVYQDVVKRVSQTSGYIEKEVERLFREAGVQNLKNEAVIYKRAGRQAITLGQSETMQRLLEANIRKTKGDVNNLTLTTAVEAQTAYINACNKAMMKVQTGAFSYDRAVADAVKEAAVQGTEVLYPSGHVDKLDVAVRRATLTGVNQSAAQLNLQYAQEAKCDYVETTAHSGARPSHAVWQGRVFCISGKDPEYPPFYESTGYGTGAGLCGWNCRHNFYAYFPGISTPAYTEATLQEYEAKKIEYNGKMYTEYEASQMQRAQERKIRETKRKLAGYDAGMKNTDDEASKSLFQKQFNEESVRLKQQEKALKDFCKKTGRQYESARTQVHAVKDDKGNIVGFNRSVARKAVWANRKTQKALAEKARNGKIIEKIKDAGMKGQIVLFPQRKLDVSNFSFDENHINGERHHRVTREDAERFIREADVEITRWNGRFINYYGPNGAVFVDTQNNNIRTAFWSEEFDEHVQKMREVLKESGND